MTEKVLQVGVALEAWLASLQGHPLLPLIMLAAFVVAGALFLSVWLVIFQTGLLFSPPWSFLLALTGALLSASLFFAIGRFVIGGFIQRKASARMLSAVKGAGLEHIVALRILPVLPFTLINLSAGAFGVPFRTFFLGTFLGMAPGVLAVTLLGDRAIAVIKQPTPLSVLALVAATVVLVVSATAVRRLARKRSPSTAERAPVAEAPTSSPSSGRASKTL